MAACGRRQAQKFEKTALSGSYLFSENLFEVLLQSVLGKP